MVEFNTHGGAGQQYQDHKVHYEAGCCLLQTEMRLEHDKTITLWFVFFVGAGDL